MPSPVLITAAQRAQLLANGAASAQGADLDPFPVVKLFTPDAWATWLLSEIDPIATNQAFGLCDLGLGEPELGFVDLTELMALRGRLGLPVECDTAFIANQPLSTYARAARAAGRITI